MTKSRALPPTPGSDWAFVRRVLIVLALAALAALIWMLADIILLLFGSVLIAVLLRAVADPITAHLRLKDPWAVMLAGLLMIAALALAAYMLGPELATQMRGLVENLPRAFTHVAEELQLGSFADLLKGSSAVSSLGNLASRIFAWGSTVLGALASFALVIFGGIYLAVNPALYRDGFIKLVPPRLHANVRATIADAEEALKLWLRGQLIAMVLVGVFTGLGLWLAGVPSALALGLISGLAEFVPIVGPIVAAVPTILVAGAQDWHTMLWAIGVLVVVQQVEGYVIMPLIANRMVSVAPAVGLYALVAMGVLFGPLGLLFGFPLVIVIDVAVRGLYVRDTLGEQVEILGAAGGTRKNRK
jgi:predicted PurR-regulated permease PerM